MGAEPRHRSGEQDYRSLDRWLALVQADRASPLGQKRRVGHMQRLKQPLSQEIAQPLAGHTLDDTAKQIGR